MCKHSQILFVVEELASYLKAKKTKCYTIVVRGNTYHVKESFLQYTCCVTGGRSGWSGGLPVASYKRVIYIPVMCNNYKINKVYNTTNFNLTTQMMQLLIQIVINISAYKYSNFSYPSRDQICPTFLPSFLLSFVHQFPIADRLIINFRPMIIKP